MDRRIKRTRTAVFNAILDLMVEKEARKITVMELCKRADINKSTFYLHYESIDDCLQSCFQIVMDGIVNVSKYIIYDIHLIALLLGMHFLLISHLLFVFLIYEIFILVNI